mgnify:CR=1 FL=1
MTLVIVNYLAMINFALYLASNWQKERITIFKLLIASNIIAIVEYILIGGIAGAIIGGLSIIQYLLFYKYHNKIVLGFMILSFCICCFVFADSWLSILLYAVLLIRCMMIYHKDPQHTRESGVMQNIIYPFYDFHYGTVLLVVVDVIKLINDSFATWKYGKDRYKKKAKQIKYVIAGVFNN